MSISQDTDTPTGRVPCPASFEAVCPSNIPINCPTCGGHVSVEPDPFGVLAIYPHSTRNPRCRAVYRLAVKLRAYHVGHEPRSPEPDSDDLARAAELLDVLAEDPDLLPALARATRRVRHHVPFCTDRDNCRGECLAGSEVF